MSKIEFTTHNEVVSRRAQLGTNFTHGKSTIGFKSYLTRFNVLNIIDEGVNCLANGNPVTECKSWKGRLVNNRVHIVRGLTYVTHRVTFCPASQTICVSSRYLIRSCNDGVSQGVEQCSRTVPHVFHWNTNPYNLNRLGSEFIFLQKVRLCISISSNAFLIVER